MIGKVLPANPWDRPSFQEGTVEKPTEQQIQNRAHELWEQAGKPDGREDEFWHRAEQELKETEELRDIATSPEPAMLLPG